MEDEIDINGETYVKKVGINNGEDRLVIMLNWQGESKFLQIETTGENSQEGGKKLGKLIYDNVSLACLDEIRRKIGK